MSTHSETIAFTTKARAHRMRAAHRRETLEVLAPAAVARRLALAHRIARDIERGLYVDYADVARRHGLTRARLSQLMDLTLLAPDIQEQVLALRYKPGKEAITERKLRAVAAAPLWSEQRRRWVGVCGARGDATPSVPGST
jgi:hypothetical protein